MRRYETIVIIDPDLAEDDRTSLFTRVQELIPQQEGILIQEDLWGSRKLAYPIRKKPRGFYARYDYCGLGPLVDELERSLRIDDRVFKYLTVLLEDDADVEKIQAEIDAAQRAKETASASEAPVDETATGAAAAETRSDTATEQSAMAAAPSDSADAEAEVTEPATETSEKE